MEDNQKSYRSIIEHLPDAFTYQQILKDSSGRPINYVFIDVNPAFENMTGLLKEEVVGKKLTDVFPEITRSSFDWIGTLGKVALTGETICMKRYVEMLNCHCEITAYKSDHGYFVLILRDVAKYINKNEVKYKELVENLNEVIYTLDENANITYVSPNIEWISGYTPAEVVNRPYTDFVHPEDLRGRIEQFSKITSGINEATEYRFVLKDGSTAWVRTTARPIFREGRLVCVQGILADITERKKIEEMLKEGEEKYRFIANNVTDVILEGDSKGIITYTSPSHYSVFGREEDPVGQNIFKYIHPEDLKMVQQIFERGLKKETTESVEYRYFHPGKGYIWLEATGRSYFDQKGDIKTLMSIRNIDKRKRAEERMRYMSFHDQMTGLYNRAYLEEEMKRLDAEKQLPVSVIMADLNGLKLVNDTYGHSKGDEMLKAAAEILKDSCRKEDVIARWGGDEFIILLPQTDLQKAQNICRRIIDKLPGVQIEDIPVSISLGAAVKDNIEKPLAEVFKEAEDDMYKNKLTESRSARGTMLNTLLKTLEEKSFETKEHVLRMQGIAEKIGKKLGLTDSELNRLNLLIKLHDIGKINISEEILTKEGPLTDKEWEIIKKHPEIGCRIARATEDFSHVAEEILSHHECWDGTGYPRGLKGEEIPLLARITAVADAYEVLSKGRPYKRAMTKEEIAVEFKRCAWTKFDPRLVEIFLQMTNIQDEHF